MSIQAQLNNQSINMIPKIKMLMSQSTAFNASQMKDKALREMMDSEIAISHMNGRQLEAFQDGLIETFKYKGWL